MSFSFGSKIKITIFGQSHSDGIGVVIDGLPSGEEIDLQRVQAFMKRRAPGRNPYSTPRKEEDRPRILSGLFQGKTCGAPLCAVIENLNTRSKDYEALKDIPRPGHADYTAYVKYNGCWDYRGGGHFSGRLTAPLCFAGGVAKQLLERKGISIGARILSVYDRKDAPLDESLLSKELLDSFEQQDFPVLSQQAGEAMKQAISEALHSEDSLGGVVECYALGLPPGIGEPFFDGLESRLSAAVFAIPAVKGVEFGAGFQAAFMKGSENNDGYVQKEAQKEKQGKTILRTLTNHHGGSLGGISSGMPLILRAAFKPTPSIGAPQRSVRLSDASPAQLRVEGRHDPCIVPRAVPCVEAAVAVSLLDLWYLAR